MLADRFDALTVGFLSSPSRRSLGRGLFGALLASLTGGGVAGAAGPRVCLVNGKPCLRPRQCCSGICRGSICQRRPVSVKSCPAGKRLCDGKCVNLRKNREHCGSCGRSCRAGDRCQKGRCILVCPPGHTACGRRCVNPRTDFNNCGRCGHACPGSQGCVAGVCTEVCTGETCGAFACGVTVEREPVCAVRASTCTTGGNPSPCWPLADSCKACSRPQDCPPGNFLAARLCLYTNHAGPCGEDEFACGWMS